MATKVGTRKNSKGEDETYLYEDSSTSTANIAKGTKEYANSLYQKYLGRSMSDSEWTKYWEPKADSSNLWEDQVKNSTEAATYATNSDTKIADEKAAEQAKIDAAAKDSASATEAERQGLIKSIADLVNNISTSRTNLINETKQEGEQFIGDVTQQRTSRLAQIADLLSKSNERQFSENAPGILEQLSGKGLLHSSDVGVQLAKEQSRLGEISNEKLTAQSLTDLDYEQKLAKQIQDEIFGIKTAGLGFETTMGSYGVQQGAKLGEMSLADLKSLRDLGITSASELGRAGISRSYSLEDRDYAAELAKEIAKINQESSNTESLAGLVGTIATIL